jgi:hypothetical protein
MNNSKLGYHFLMGGENYPRDYHDKLKASKPQVAKFVVSTSPNDLNILHEYIASGVTYVIARIFDFDERLGTRMQSGWEPERAADEFIASLAYVVNANSLWRVWFEFGKNEPGREWLPWLDKFYVYALPKLKTMGIKTVVYNFSVGTPEIGELSSVMGASVATIMGSSGYCMVGMHEGSMGGRLQKDYDWYALRHRKYTELSGIPIVMTECCMDNPPFASAGISSEDYYNDFVWLDTELRKDTNIVGACIYTCNRYEWGDWSIVGSVMDKIIAYNVNNICSTSANSVDSCVVKTSGNVNVRSGPGLGYKILGMMSRDNYAIISGESCKNVGLDKSWIFVRVNSELSGWVAAWLLKKN